MPAKRRQAQWDPIWKLAGNMNMDDALWVDKLSDMLERRHVSLQQVPVRTKVAAQIVIALQAIARDMQRGSCDADAVCKLLTTTKVMMRDRRGIEELLSVATLELFLSLAESADTAVAEDALKCVINSVYSRPEFVRDHALPHANYATRLLRLSTRAAPATFHWVVWKALLVSCEADEMIHTLAYNLDTWTHIHTTLHFCLHGGSASAFPSGQGRMDLSMELVKLIAVLVNDLKLSPPRLDAVELLATLQPLGEVLLQTLQYTPPHMSPFDAQLIDLKNKVVEIFLFIPTPLLGFFVQQQHDALSAIMGHLYSMLVLVRIEKTRLAKDLQPVLMACHHLTSTGDPGIRAFFKAHIFPSEELQTQPRKPAPPAFFHKHLTFFLTSLDTTVKRCMGEWLYLLCDQNADEYTRRTGLGNAIGLLRIKGLA